MCTTVCVAGKASSSGGGQCKGSCGTGQHTPKTQGRHRCCWQGICGETFITVWLLALGVYMRARYVILHCSFPL